MYQGLSRAENTIFIKKLAAADPASRMNMMNSIDKVILERAYTTGVTRRYFKGTSLEDTEGEGMRIVTMDMDIYDDLVYEKPSVKYYLQPDPRKGVFGAQNQAVFVGVDGTPALRTFAGQRYVESFETMKVNPIFKTLRELLMYPYDIVTFYENDQYRVALDKEDSMMFRLQNYLLNLGRTSLANKNIMTANSRTFSFSMFSYLKDLHKSKQIPFSRLFAHFSLLNEKERVADAEIRQLSYEGVQGKTNLDEVYGMTPLILEDKRYCYYSFDKANASNEDEQEQFFINLSDIAGRNVAEFADISDEATRNAAAIVVKDYLEGMGYKWTAPTSATTRYGTGYEFAQYLDIANFSPLIPIYGEEFEEAVGAYKEPIISVLGKTMMRSVVLPPRNWFGHFDLFESDTTSVFEKNEENIMMFVKEELILTAKNMRAVTSLDIWTANPVYTGS